MTEEKIAKDPIDHAMKLLGFAGELSAGQMNFVLTNGQGKITGAVFVTTEHELAEKIKAVAEEYSDAEPAGGEDELAQDFLVNKEYGL